MSASKPGDNAATDTHECHLEDRDEAVWMVCSCGWDKRMGYTCTAAQAWAAEQRHQAEMHSGPPIV